MAAGTTAAGTAYDTGQGTYDVVVVGLGIMGAATVAHLAERGVRVLGVEGGPPAHTQGSSHGSTRIFRRAYWEGGTYVPLLERAYAGWHALDADGSADGPVVLSTGGLFVGSTRSRLVSGSRQTALEHGIAHDVLTAAEVGRAFPAFRLRDDQVGLVEPDAMMLAAPTARTAFLTRATRAGAHLAHDRPVRSLTSTASGVTVAGDGWAVTCARVVVAAGGWAQRLLPHDLTGLVRPMRIPVFELAVDPRRAADHAPGRFPVFLVESDDGALVYGLPPWRPGAGVRIGFHNRQLSPADMDAPRVPATAAERREVAERVRRLLPGLRAEGTGTACVYTLTPDESFLLGTSREHPAVAYVSACSGHGFKFAPAIGEAMSELVLDGRTTVDLAPFDAARFRGDGDLVAAPGGAERVTAG